MNHSNSFKNGTFIPIVILFLILSSCDYYVSDVPISDNLNSKIDSNALGSWGSYEDSTLIYALRIDALDEKNYIINYVHHNEVKLDFGMYNNYIGHSSNINGKEYINVKILDGEIDEKGKYMIFTYSITADSLITNTIDIKEFNEKFNNSNSFQEYINKNGEEFNNLFKPTHKLKRIKPDFPL